MIIMNLVLALFYVKILDYPNWFFKYIKKEGVEGFKDILDEDGKRRLYTNPLRVLDTKNPALQEMAANAPKLIDFLGEESLAHFEGVQRILKANNIPFKINPRLVRGLDYYNLTVFEWIMYFTKLE